MRRSLKGMYVPEHGPGFWDSVERGLEQAAADEGGEGDDANPVLVPLSRHRRTRVSPWLAAVAAAAVVLASGGVTAMVFRSAGGNDTAGDRGSGPTTTAAAAAPATTAPTPTIPVGLAPAPWSAAAIPPTSVPSVIADEWGMAENKRWCSALAPTDLGLAAAAATPRAAMFDGGWGVAWDLPSGPGQTVTGEDCPDCGRSAFGIAGTGQVEDAQVLVRRPTSVAWSDGSVASYGTTPGQTTSKRIATLVVAGQGCAYEVWSNLGEAHLGRLVDGLRTVRGLQAEPVTMRRASDEPTVTERAVPPWAGSAVLASEVDPLVFAQWRALEIEGQQLVIDDLGTELRSATIRTWEDGVAWDNPYGPGHDAADRPCAGCGRGVVGIGWQPVSPAVTVDGVSLPYLLEWSDGSWAEYGGRLANPAIPRDRVVYFDPETGEETMDALQAIVHVVGMNQDVVVWTHLGEAHLLYLIDQLRIVVPD